MRRSTRHRLAVGLLALGVVPLCGYGATANAHGAPWAPPPPEEASLVVPAWSGLTPAEKEDGMRQLDPEKAKRLTEFFDQMNRGEWIPVSAGGQVIGKVSPKVLERPRMPRSKLELVPICDDQGNLAGYWGGPIGVIDVQEAKKQDLRTIAAKRGLNPDGTVIDLLLGQVPVPRIDIPPPFTEPTTPPTTTPTTEKAPHTTPPPTTEKPPHSWPHKPR